MAYPYKKMTSEDFDYIRSVTASDRVWVGDEIAKEYYRDEMPEYGVFPPELYVEVLNKEEISAIMAYAYKENIPVAPAVKSLMAPRPVTCARRIFSFFATLPISSRISSFGSRRR